MRPKSLFNVSLTLLSIALLTAVASPVWKPLLLGAVLAATLLPWHDWLTARMRGRRRLSAVLLLVGLVVPVVLLLAWVVSVAVREALAGIDFARDVLERSGPEGLLLHLPHWMSNAVRRVLGFLATSTEDLAGLVARRAPATAAAVGTALGVTAQVVVQAVFLLIAFYFFLLGGRRLVAWLASISPDPEETMEIAGRLARASRSVLSSLFLTALVQSVTATVGYLIAGVPQPVFFGLLTFVAAFIPSVGTTIVALPVALLMLALGHPWAALFLALWALAIVGLIDNVVKPLLIKGGVHISAAVLFFALIGGLAMFGPVGLILGPLAVSFFVGLVSPSTTAPEPAIAREQEKATETAPH
jgi:predicted PurR-regulated permease PerM